MKKIYLLSSLLLLLVFVSNGSLQAQALSPEEAKAVFETEKDFTEATIVKVLELSEKRNYWGLSKVMAYTGGDPNRSLQVKINYDDPHERLTVENTLNRLNRSLKKSALYNLTNFRRVQGMENYLYYWDVEFTTLKGKVKKSTLSLVKLGEKYLFCNVM